MPRPHTRDGLAARARPSPSLQLRDLLALHIALRHKLAVAVQQQVQPPLRHGCRRALLAAPHRGLQAGVAAAARRRQGGRGVRAATPQGVHAHRWHLGTRNRRQAARARPRGAPSRLSELATLATGSDGNNQRRHALRTRRPPPRRQQAGLGTRTQPAAPPARTWTQRFGCNVSSLQF